VYSTKTCTIDPVKPAMNVYRPIPSMPYRRINTFKTRSRICWITWCLWENLWKLTSDLKMLSWTSRRHLSSWVKTRCSRSTRSWIRTRKLSRPIAPTLRSTPTLSSLLCCRLHTIQLHGKPSTSWSHAKLTCTAVHSPNSVSSRLSKWWTSSRNSANSHSKSTKTYCIKWTYS